MADAGIPLHILQDILGLASIKTTRGYLHHDNRYLASAREQANAFLSAAGQRKHARRSGPASRGL
jgi:site-specific recombinase XerD